ncbi:hypothetical protein NIE88_18700 [Sporolactobacillus shoreicorticis]|uniref:Uncharacterized protein n=1 Tax=Sporolactobacillus shoreicorticis TaxID=1923877 RepID=A0ABW5S5Q1_9BACL|nr:hypothetical protein [Sporolactobacillus shoreicorticis]MCO7127779.1 hypothetical protein [Sporolactobacillus shoreicorticis]
MTVLAIFIFAPITVFGLATYAAYRKGCEYEDQLQKEGEHHGNPQNQDPA